ncbi:MAG: TauD/TfdA family dioxygenase [Actinomycetia bacterium]|nr:TauD/TfdA family dioxygenase [Actinomycetes bacterium]
MAAERGVLLVRDQEMTVHQHAAFAHRLGPLSSYPTSSHRRSARNAGLCRHQVDSTKGDAEADAPDHHRVELLEIDVRGYLVILGADVPLEITQIDEVTGRPKLTGVRVGT